MSQEATQASAPPTAAPAAQPAAAAPSSPEGLFPQLVKAAPPPAPAADTNTQAADDWYFMPGIKGEGARPDFLEPKYASMADQAKAYRDLASKLGMRAPDKYDLSKFEDKIDPSNEHVVGLMTFAKDKNLGQDVVEGIFDTYAKIVDASRIDYAKEIEKLGKDGRQKIETVATWASNTLSEGAIATINKMGHTAEFINLLDELRQFHSYANQAAQPPGVTAAPTAFKVETVASIEAEMLVPENSVKYINDAGYRADINARLRRATGE